MANVAYQSRYERPSIQDAIARVAGHIKRVHQACRLVPQISPHDFDQLVDSIKANGLLRPIEIDRNGLLIDGRCRLMACAAAGIELGPDDFVVTDADPYAIAGSNNARRHLTKDQKVMEAARLLEEERKRAAQRKREGAKKGNQSQQQSRRGEAHPGDESPKKRGPRAIDIVVDQTDVPQGRLAIADKLCNAAPDLAEKVESGDLSLDEAAEKAGITPKKRDKAKRPAPKKKAPKAESSCDADQADDGQVYGDDVTEIKDLPKGIRIHRCQNATLYVHKSNDSIGIVIPDGENWWWLVGPQEAEGTVTTREEAEDAVLARIEAQTRTERPKRKPQVTPPRKPR